MQVLQLSNAFSAMALNVLIEPIGQIRFSSTNHLNHAMMVCHLSGDKPNVTIFTNGPSSEDPALKEAMDAAQSTGYIFDERIIIELTRTPNEQKKVP